MDSATEEAPKISATITKAAQRYLNKLRSGERILRDSAGRLQWASGKPVGTKTVRYLLEQGEVQELDTDLFGERSRGQTIGLSS